MKAASKGFCVFILIMGITAIGLPVFSPNDINRDANIDLQDLIMSVRDFTGSADIASEFRSGFKGAVNTLKIVAGLKAEIKHDKKNGPLNSQTFPNLQYIIPTDIFCLASCFSTIVEKDSIYKSIPLQIDTPPPKGFPAC